MKEKIKNNNYLMWGLTIFCVLCALLVLFFAIYRWYYIRDFIVAILNIFMPFIYGLVIAYLLNPCIVWFEKKVYNKLADKIVKGGNKRKFARTMSLFTTTVIFVGFIVLLFSFFIPELISSLQMFVTNVTEYVNNTKEILIHVFGGSDSIREFINDNYSKVSDTFIGWVNDGMLNDLISSLGNGIFKTFKLIYNFIIGYIIAVYILIDKERFKGQIRKLLYSLFDDDKINVILDNVSYTDKIFMGFFSAKLIDSLIIGLICFAGMLLFRMPYALIIAVIVGVTNIIPYFGPFIGAVPSALLILLVAPQKCIPFIIFVFVLQQFDGNILGPKILGNKTGLSSFWVLCSLLIFGGLFGVLGMIIGVPIFSILYSFINGVIKRKLASKKLPINTKDYMDDDDWMTVSCKKTKGKKLKKA